jgi:type-F conjugative transfer system pilin assembly protein TrbC
MRRMIDFTVWIAALTWGMTANAVSDQQPFTTMSSIDIFISLSMPKDSLHAWQEDARRYHARLVLRGLLNNSLQDTVNALTLDKDNVIQVSIDPTLFHQYEINQVPAVVLSQRDHYDVVYGNTRLTAALETIARVGELKQVATRLLS